MTFFPLNPFYRNIRTLSQERQVKVKVERSASWFFLDRPLQKEYVIEICLFLVPYYESPHRHSPVGAFVFSVR